MRAVISVANVAARTGKTTVAVNLAAELASRGLRVLFVDADPQARATPYFLEGEQIVRTLSDVLLPRPLHEGGRARPLWDVFSAPGFPSLGVVAGHITLAAFEGLDASHVTDLRDRMGLLWDYRDVAVLDTPSSLALLTRTCLHSSTHVLVPVTPDGPGEEGLRLISEYLGRMKGDTKGGRPPGLLVVCNHLAGHDHPSERLHGRLRDEYGGRMLDTILYRNETISACAKHHQPARATAPASVIATLFARLADEVMLRLGFTGTAAGGPGSVR